MAQKKRSHIDLIIVGAGPIGLSCGIAAERAGISYKILDKGCLVNSIQHFPESMTFFSSSNNLEIGDVPFTSLSLRPSKQEALEYYRRIADHFDLKIGLYEAFEFMERLSEVSDTGRFRLHSAKAEYACNFIVNATGFFDVPVLLDVPGEDLDKVRHYFKSAHHLFRQKLLVVGGSNSAVDVALEGFRKGAEVTMLVRRDDFGKGVKYWVRPDLEARIREGNIKVHFEAEVVEVRKTEVLFRQNGTLTRIDNDFVYAMTGYQPNFDLCRKMGIAMDSNSGLPQYDPATMETNAKGVYLAGVVCGGENTREWFIENSRDHGAKIVSHVQQALA